MTRLGTRVAAAPVPATAAAALVLAGLAAVAMTTGNGDGVQDSAVTVSQLPWPELGAVLLLPLVAVLHYVSAGLALRDLSGRPLPLRQSTLVQLAAAATNRVIPSGIGGAGVGVRYLLRVGLAPGAATTALAALSVIGGLTDAAYVGVVATVGPMVGLRGASHEVATLAGRGVAAGRGHSWLLAAAVALAIVVVVVRQRRRGLLALRSSARHAAEHLRALVTQPRRVATAAAASTATTVSLSIGFVLAVRAFGDAPRPLPAAAVIAIYWVAVAAGGAVPLPPFFGMTEAALITGLVVSGYTTTSATVAVLTFRLITFWLALPTGLWAARRLRRAQLL